MKIDYNEASRTYDSTRKSDKLLIDIFQQKVSFSAEKNILDFACGTGNYLFNLSKTYKGNFYGLEPSEGMRQIAQDKNPEIIIKDGDHENIPYDNCFFDFIFMTDVIHHIPDLNRLFSSFHKKLKENAIVCILTSSHKQIKTRWYNDYFPSLSKNEMKRYPDIEEIVARAKNNGLPNNEIQIMEYGNTNVVSKDFIQMVEEKNYSMFRQLDVKEYEVGLKRLKQDIDKVIVGQSHSETLVWLTKAIRLTIASS